MSARPEVTKKSDLTKQSYRHSAFKKTCLITIRPLITEKWQFGHIDDVLLLQPEVPLSTTTIENLK